MKRHTDLINALSADVKPVSPDVARRQLAGALVIGGAISLVGVIAIFGLQPGLDTFAHGAPMGVKSTYAMSLAGIAIALTLAAARPGARSRVGWKWIAVPVSGCALLALIDLSRAPVTNWPPMVFGASWSQCSLRIAALAGPVFIGLCLAIRAQAPTNLRESGAAAGLLAGTVAATSYALACPESSAAFIFVWYSLGIAIVTGMGALLGPRLLRW